MKKIAMLFMLLICTVSLNAQDTIRKDTNSINTIRQYEMISGKKGNSAFGPARYYIPLYTIRVNSDYASSLYFEKGGKNLMWGGIVLSTGVIVGLLPTVLSNPNKNTIYGCYAIAGGLSVISIIQFIIGGSQISKGCIILRTNKKYIIETDGTTIKFKF